MPIEQGSLRSGGHPFPLYHAHLIALFTDTVPYKYQRPTQMTATALTILERVRVRYFYCPFLNNRAVPRDQCETNQIHNTRKHGVDLSVLAEDSRDDEGLYDIVV